MQDHNAYCIINYKWKMIYQGNNVQNLLKSINFRNIKDDIVKGSTNIVYHKTSAQNYVHHIKRNVIIVIYIIIIIELII